MRFEGKTQWIGALTYALLLSATSLWGSSKKAPSCTEGIEHLCLAFRRHMMEEKAKEGGFSILVGKTLTRVEED